MNTVLRLSRFGGIKNRQVAFAHKIKISVMRVAVSLRGVKGQR